MTTPSRRFLSAVLMLALTPAALGAAQRATPAQTASRAATAPLPQYVRFGAELKEYNGKPASGVVGITFLLYEEEKGGSPLWLETQNVTLDEKGRFSVMLGAGTPEGLPAELFTAKQARWLAMEPQGLPAPARVMLLSVPYALKAGDAETFGGMSPSAFLRAAQGGLRPADAQVSPASEAHPALTGGGTAGFVPMWANSSGKLGNSMLFQSGSGTTSKLGIGTGTPAATLDVKGGVIARGALQLPSKATASAAQGSLSQPLTLQASAFDSTSHSAVAPKFQWQAEPTGNNTSHPAGTLNLLYSSTGTPAETGLSIAGNGRITFAAGQTFPGTGNGTVTGVTAGTGLTGGGTTGKVTLGLDTSKVPQLNTANTFTTDQSVLGNLSASKLNVSGTASFTGLVTFASGQTFPGTGGGTITAVSPGTGLAGGGTSGSVILGIDATKVPLLVAANTFTGDQTVTGNLKASATVTGATVNATNGFNLGGKPFGFGSFSSSNSFLGFAGNSNAAGQNNVGIGENALLDFATGSGNAVVGAGALKANVSGSNNSAVGYLALANTTGSNNTAVGANSGPDSTHGNLSNATAIGANALVSASNSLVLGSINGVNGATADTLVGIGTTAPAATLDVHGSANFTGLVTFAPSQTFSGAVTSVTAGTGLTSSGNSSSPTLSLNTTYSDGRYAQLGASNTYTGTQVINGKVGVGILPAKAYALHVNGQVRAETGLSIGGAAALLVDAPGITGGHFIVTTDGFVGIRNANPKNTLDVGGNISTNSGVEAGNAIISGPLTAGSVQVGGDTAMSAAPHMYMTGYVPGPMGAGANETPIISVPSKNILVTRMVAFINNGSGCPSTGKITFAVVSGPSLISSTTLNQISIDASDFFDSGPLALAIPAGDVIQGVVHAPNCGSTWMSPPSHIAVSIEYVMQ
ncbi:MAG TPA: hypothetical protein VLZ50_00405 [Terracidiphilus sp.]|nr:hypothetical protein [Terracidiphilus sp.]